MYFYVSAYYCKEIALIDDKHKHHGLHPQDDDHYHFLKGMRQTYCSLTSADEPDIFDINRDQKFELNQVIHFAFTNWEAPQSWYHGRCHSAIKKDSLFRLVPPSWQNIKVYQMVVNEKLIQTILSLLKGQ